uniref:Rap-GAP domain-containing protein n=1 Tax=Macrostomum lignano TaxID=282301 RepID=A0A1I8FG39_9PLAT
LVCRPVRSGPRPAGASDSRLHHSLLRLGKTWPPLHSDFNGPWRRHLRTCEHFSSASLAIWTRLSCSKATDSGAPQSSNISRRSRRLCLERLHQHRESENKDHNSRQQRLSTAGLYCYRGLICVAPTSFAAVRGSIHRDSGVTSAAVKLSAAVRATWTGFGAAVAAFARDVHSIGLVYADQHQSAESEFFSNQAGSSRYAAFLRRLATPRDLLRDDDGAEPEAGMPRMTAAAAGSEIRVFHAVTAMRPAESGRGREGINRKKRLVGNDLTAVIYQEAGSRYGVESIATQCLFSHLVIQPLPNGLNRVRLVVKDVPGLADSFSDWRLCLVGDNALPLIASQLALLTDLAAQVATGAPRDAANPGGNVYLARLLQLRRVWNLADRETGIGCLADQSDNEPQQLQRQLEFGRASRPTPLCIICNQAAVGVAPFPPRCHMCSQHLSVDVANLFKLKEEVDELLRAYSQDKTHKIHKSHNSHKSHKAQQVQLPCKRCSCALRPPTRR